MNVGVTERGDAGLDFSWESRLLQANILITKSVNDKFIDKVLEHKDNVIIHVTCTGFGGTVIEPHVQPLLWTYNQVKALIQKGFPAKQIVLRTDPIIPTEKGIQTVEKVWDLFQDTGIQRVRYSFIDMYPHVTTRFKDQNIPVPFETFSAPKSMVENTLAAMEKYEDTYEFEACAEFTKHRLGCISKKDFDILGIKFDDKPTGYQRKGCLCIAGKHELLNSKYRCPHQCIYCYWRDEP